jgi:hypothetical protein
MQPALVIDSPQFHIPRGCYYAEVFNFGNPKTPGQWIGHIVVAMIGLFLICWMLRVYVL